MTRDGSTAGHGPSDSTPSDAGRAEAVVVKLGGTTLIEQQDVLGEIVELQRTRPVVIVHGGGKRLTEWLQRLGVESRFDAGRRVTDDATLEVFLAVIAGVINAELTEVLLAAGAPAVGVRGIDAGMIQGPLAPGLGRVISEPRADAALLAGMLVAHHLPVLAPMGLDPDGRICNVNADDAAAAISAAIGGELVLLTDTDGVRDAAGQRIPELTAAEAEALIVAGVIAGGMLPKVHAALRAIGPGSSARRAMISDGRTARALERALHEGAGTGFRPG